MKIGLILLGLFWLMVGAVEVWAFHGVARFIACFTMGVGFLGILGGIWFDRIFSKYL